MKRELGSLATHRGFLGKPPKRGSVTPFPMAPAKVFSTQVAGLAKRLKAIGCKDVVIGLSGGLDSTLVLLVAVAAFERLGYDRTGIHVVTMPGFGTSSRTKGNAELLCEGLGLPCESISIVRSVRQHLKDIGHDGKTTDITYENAQARMRTMILMDRANMTGGIVLGTGDLSEIALGWCTYNGDHMSMFGVNSGVPKTVIRRVCRWWAEREVGGGGGVGVGGRRGAKKAAQAVLDIVATPVSPELKKGQVTENTLGPYELHDFFLWNFIVNEMGPSDLQKAAERFFLGNQTIKALEKRVDATACRVSKRGGLHLSETRQAVASTDAGGFASASIIQSNNQTISKALIAKTLRTFLRRFFTQAFKRNCQPDGIRVFPFELSLRGWWIPSDLGSVTFPVTRAKPRSPVDAVVPTASKRKERHHSDAMGTIASTGVASIFSA